MPFFQRHSGYLTVLLVCVITVSGCVTPGKRTVEPVSRPAVFATEPAEGLRWRQIGFKFAWPEKVGPAWHLDLLVAHRVVAPVLEHQRKAISLWRFHRRAARDATGHRFSLLVYVDDRTSDEVFTALQTAPDVRDLQSSGKLISLSMEAIGTNGGRSIEATSDPRWSIEVQKSWPWFIMGVSRMWLTLADEKARLSSALTGSVGLEARIDFYADLNQRISRTWEQEGAHALLHHLNAIFGYEPLIIREERLIRF